MVERTRPRETDGAELACFLRRELGYQSDAPGALRSQRDECRQALREVERTLRGQGGEMGLVGWVDVLRRTWVTLIALLGAALGYVLNDVVEAIPPRRAPLSANASGDATVP